MICNKCGAEIPDGVRFCGICGAEQTISASQTTINLDGEQVKPGNPITINNSETKLVAAKCTNCGAALEVNPNQDAAVCPFCDMPYIVDKAIQNFNITNTYIGTQINIQGADPDNMIRMAKEAINAGKYEDAIAHADKALLANPKNINAWIIKIEAAGHDIKGDRSSEIAAYVDSALKNDISDDEEANIYKAVLEVSIIHLKEAAHLLDINQDRIKNQVSQHRNKNDIAAMDSGYVADTSEIANEAIEYRMNVPDRLVSSNSDVQKKVVEVGDAYKKYCESLDNRYHIYGSSLSGKLEQKKEDNLSKILSGIPGANIPHIKQEPKKGLFGKLFG